MVVLLLILLSLLARFDDDEDLKYSKNDDGFFLFVAIASAVMLLSADANSFIDVRCHRDGMLNFGSVAGKKYRVADTPTNSNGK